LKKLTKKSQSNKATQVTNQIDIRIYLASAGRFLSGCSSSSPPPPPPSKLLFPLLIDLVLSINLVCIYTHTSDLQHTKTTTYSLKTHKNPKIATKLRNPNYHYTHNFPPQIYKALKIQLRFRLFLIIELAKTSDFPSIDEKQNTKITKRQIDSPKRITKRKHLLGDSFFLDFSYSKKARENL
jgi:hypothetical protein